MLKAIFSLGLASLVLAGVLGTRSTAFAEEPQRSYDEHVRLITDVDLAPMEIEVRDPYTGQRSTKTVEGSYFIPVSSTDYINIVCGGTASSTRLEGGEFYVYFYDQELNVNWNILDHTDEATGERNRVSIDYLREHNGFQFSGVPDGSYIRIAKANDHMCRLLIWDGCKSGYPISSLSTGFLANGVRERLPSDASGCIQLPATALYLIAKPGYTFTSAFTSNTTDTEAIPYAEDRFPAQLVYLTGFYGAGRAKNIQVVRDYDYASGEYAAVVPDADLSDAVIAVDKELFQPSELDQSPVFQRIADCMDFTWTAKSDVVDCWGARGTSNGLVGVFREGITYHGIPYRSAWSSAVYVGWHVSKQTFINAANDPDSIFYHNASKGSPGPYYSLVCSSFGSLVSGFDYPMTNYSMMKDPQLQVRATFEPVIGGLMTNGIGHCYIPMVQNVSAEGTSVLTLAEEIGPVTAIRSVFDSITKSWKGVGLPSGYPSEYIYCVSADHFSPVPYDITHSTIINGSARPYRGDQSVYSSAMNVRINIKDPEATRLYYQPFDVVCDHGLLVSAVPSGQARYMDIEPGARQVILRSATKNGGFTGAELENGTVYGVWASRDDAQSAAPSNVEFFEWYDLEREKITYQILDGTLVTDDVFWYAIGMGVNGEDYIRANHKGGLISIPYQAPDGAEQHSDYSAFAERARIKDQDSMWAFFKKGVFGAYVTKMELADDFT